LVEGTEGEVMRVNHYKWLDKHLQEFLKKMGVKIDWMDGLISAHGDKCYGYRLSFEKAGISFPHGVAIYLLTYFPPWAKEVRETDKGWVPVDKWIIENKDRFLPFLPPVDPNDPEVLS
jgi:hypothetical protein